ncbi:unnamed protein product [Orchesella dallaii]|uniref:Lipase domain-containing protein n=1 Tax=Orchesella dallaii TaxID=48710 RepID=A0ABP1QCN4_9HEXA
METKSLLFVVVVVAHVFLFVYTVMGAKSEKMRKALQGTEEITENQPFETLLNQVEDEFLAAHHETSGRLLLEAILDYYGREFMEQWRKRRKEQISYLLRRPEQKKWLKLSREGRDVQRQVAEGWFDELPVKILLHGFTPYLWLNSQQNIARHHMFEIAQAYENQARRKYNVIVVDWTSLSMEPPHKYYEAVVSSSLAGEDVGDFLIKLKNLGLISDWDKVHIIGFSLGCHVAGVAGHRVEQMTGEKVGRITGIDPAGPLFDRFGKLPNDTSKVLDKSDGKFVDIIHCNMGYLYSSGLGRYGTTVQCGHADFYPDGGETQLACSSFLDRKDHCSHMVCAEYYTESINNLLLSCPCESWEEYVDGKCECTKDTGGIFMGEPAEIRATGKYFISMG